MTNIRFRLQNLANLRELVKTWQYRYMQGALLFVIIFFIIAIGILPTQYALEVGEISPETIYAPRTVVDHAATSQARQQAAEAVADVYLLDQAITTQVVENVTGLLLYVLATKAAADEEADQQELVAALVEEYPDHLDEHSAAALLALSEEQLEAIASELRNNIIQTMQGGIKDVEVETHLHQLINKVYQLPVDAQTAAVLAAKLETHFRPNMQFSPEATENERRKAMDAVEEVRILKGAKIIDRGETVTAAHISQLQALGLLHTSHNYGFYLGLAGILLGVFGTWAYYLYRFRQEIFNDALKTLLLGLIIIITLVFAKVFDFYLSPYLIPASMVSLLLTIIFDINLALFFGLTLSVLLAVMTGGEINVLVVSVLGCVVAAYSVIQVNQRSDLTRAGLVVAGVNALAIMALRLTGEGLTATASAWQGLVADMAMGFGSGLLAAVLAIGLLPFFENSFGITTAVRLLELANPNQKPLKRLLLEAPGTYHHSIVVGNLAEAAAEAVGADPILARVGSYYHDLGKLARPYFFIENQFSGNNPHDKIPPSLSSMIITAHVKTGVQLAEQYKLPTVIKDIIQQHHGDSLIGFFYHRAIAERGGKDHLLEDKFRYDGPRPQFKEAGIIMLADSVEAAVRSLAQPNPFRIASMVNRIIQDRLGDGQLDQCDLTLKDLNLISAAFVRVLTGIYHKRIAYPTEQDLARSGS